MDYDEWITDYVSRHNGQVHGRCRLAVDEMASVFPELVKVPGHVYCSDWGRRVHWWLTDPNGKIVDPTRQQFGFVCEYEPFVPGTSVRVGTCFCCGEGIFATLDSLDEVSGLFPAVCSVKCEGEWVAGMGI